MSELDDVLGSVLKGEVSELIGAEDLMVEALRDIIRDEIKHHIRQKLEERPELRAEMRDAIGTYFEARVQEATAGLRIARVGARVGVELLPDHLKKEISEELQGIVEEEVGRILAKSV